MGDRQPVTSRPIRTKPQLIRALREAAEIEQQLMVQYLYAGFSLKKRPDERCNAAQFEYVRRWGSTLLMVARQEMEHLALANGILTALDADPWFSRENIPRQSLYYLGANLAAEKAKSGEVVPCDIPFVFERFNRATIGRFVCAESPGYDTLKASGDPIPTWCFGTAERPCPSHSEAEYAHASSALHALEGARPLYPLARTHLAPEGVQGGSLESAVGVAEIHPGTITELYALIQEAINTLPGLFTGNPSQQVFVPVEYQVNIFPIVDVASANLAIELIVEEGEGISAPPGFLEPLQAFLRHPRGAGGRARPGPPFRALAPAAEEPPARGDHEPFRPAHLRPLQLQLHDAPLRPDLALQELRPGIQPELPVLQRGPPGDRLRAGDDHAPAAHRRGAGLREVGRRPAHDRSRLPPLAGGRSPPGALRP
jgi:hypothetical protein